MPDVSVERPRRGGAFLFAVCRGARRSRASLSPRAGSG